MNKEVYITWEHGHTEYGRTIKIVDNTICNDCSCKVDHLGNLPLCMHCWMLYLKLKALSW